MLKTKERFYPKVGGRVLFRLFNNVDKKFYGEIRKGTIIEIIKKHVFSNSSHFYRYDGDPISEKCYVVKAYNCNYYLRRKEIMGELCD